MSDRISLILAAHGDGDDSPTNRLVEEHAAGLRLTGIAHEVLTAYHRGTPTFADVLDQVTTGSATIVPFMTSAGHYAETVLPAQLQQNPRFSALDVRITRPVGAHRAMASLVGHRVRQLLRDHQLAASRTALVIVGHGSLRHPGSRDATLTLTSVVEARGLVPKVRAVFLDEEPRLEDIQQMIPTAHLLVIPFLIGGGHHATVDIPARLGLSGVTTEGAVRVAEFAGRRIVIDRPIGADPGLQGVVTHLVRRTQRLTPAAPSAPPVGSVALVGAGPGDPDLISVRGLDRLTSADVIVTDRLVSPLLLARARKGAEIVDAGKGPGSGVSQEWINDTLIAHARAGKKVVRLKGGDPFVFGRGAEEMAACRAAGVIVEAVPGISSAIAVPAAVGIPVSHRGMATSFAVVTAHATGGLPVDLSAHAGIDTLVVLMGRSRIGTIAAQLIEAGRDPSTPTALVQEGTTPRQRHIVARLDTIAEAADAAGIGAPAILVVGEVVTLADEPTAEATAAVAEASVWAAGWGA